MDLVWAEGRRFSRIVLCCHYFGLLQDFPGALKEGIAAADGLGGSFHHGFPKSDEIFLVQSEACFPEGFS